VLTACLVAILVLTVVWGENPMLFVKRSSPVTLLGITRDVTYVGSSTGYLAGNFTSGCKFCPLTIDAGSTASVNLGMWWANTTEIPGKSAVMNWSIVSPYPFVGWQDRPLSDPSAYGWHDTDTAGPNGSGGFGFTLTLSIPYTYSGLPATGNITFTMTATAV
jgi:hypothetical protein